MPDKHTNMHSHKSLCRLYCLGERKWVRIIKVLGEETIEERTHVDVSNRRRGN